MTRVVAVAAMLLLLTGCSLLPREVEETPIDVATPVLTQREVTLAKLGTIESRLSLPATFGAERQVPLYFRSGGRVRHLHAAFGQAVAPGQLLAELESGSLGTDLALAELEVERVRAAMDLARSRQGFADGPTQEELLRYEFDLRQAEIRLQRHRDLLADLSIYAPLAGQVVNLAIAEGDQVQPYQEVLSVAAAGRTVARINVDEATAARLAPGMRAEIFPSDGDSAPVMAHVLTVPPVGSDPKGLTVVISPDEPSERLVPGRNGTVEIILQSKADALIVPLSAVRTFGGRRFVTMVKGDTRQEVAVQTGIEGEEYIEITEGLQVGDRVISR